MSLNYITSPWGEFTNTSGLYILDQGVTVNGSDSADRVLFHTGTNQLLVEIRGAALDNDDHVISLADALFTTVTVTETGSVNGGSNYGVAISGDYSHIINEGQINASHGIGAFGEHNSIVNTGTVTSVTEGILGYGIRLGFLGGEVGGSLINKGLVQSDYIGTHVASTGGRFENEGKVIADVIALRALGPNVYAENSGLLKSGDKGVSFESSGGSLLNTGKIKAENAGVYASGTLTLVNKGLIASKTATAIEVFGEGLITNSGKVKGDLAFGTGDDFYFGKGKGVVKGTVFGGEGNDSFYGTKANDRFDGGLDWDVLRGEGGDDELHGGAAEDFVAGGTGDDLVIGGSDDDHVIGGKGNDVLWGDDDTGTGSGADIFRYLEKNAGKDRIMDFDNGSDIIAFDASRVEETGFSTRLADAATQKGNNVVLNLAKLGDMKGQIIFKDMTTLELDVFDFDFWAV